MSLGDNLQYNADVERKHKEIIEEMNKCLKNGQFARYCELLGEYYKYKQKDLWSD